MISPEALGELVFEWWGLRPRKVVPLIGDGSKRRFFRVHLPRESLILVWPQPGEQGKKEARSYYRLGLFFRAHGLPVPEILVFREPEGVLLLEDLGDLRLAEHPRRNLLYPQAVKILVRLQALRPQFPLEAVLETPFYDRQLVWEKEVLYFETWYLRRRQRRRWLPEERARWREWVEEAFHRFLPPVVLHRDFQARNLMVKGDRVYLIDFQGARLGPPSYDLASLLYDPYVSNLPRKKLLELYLALSGQPREAFLEELSYTRVFRLMQALGAFVRLSFEGKKWFETFIAPGEKRLKALLPLSLKRTIWKG